MIVLLTTQVIISIDDSEVTYNKGDEFNFHRWIQQDIIQEGAIIEMVVAIVEHIETGQFIKVTPEAIKRKIKKT